MGAGRVIISILPCLMMFRQENAAEACGMQQLSAKKIHQEEVRARCSPWSLRLGGLADKP
jgi:hypothetical protein